MTESVSDKEVLASFNTWKFKREQPHTAETLLQTIASAIQKDAPLQLLMYWGKGERDVPGTRETAAIQLLSNMLNGIEKCYTRGAELTLLFTDTHAQLNGYPAQGIETYINEIKTLIGPYKFRTTRMSAIAPLNETELETRDGIDSSLLTLLTEMASKHCKRYEPAKAARMYYLQNQIEKRAVANAFASSIFLTYNGSDLNPILPLDLPIFYMYSVKEGTSVKPWFDDVLNFEA